MPRIQANRKAAVITPLGDDTLLFKSLSATEELGRLFRIELELLSENRQIQFDDILGQNATVRLLLPNGKTRYFNGFVSRFLQVPDKEGMASYRATLSPWLWFMTRMADCCIFQEMTAPEIIQQVFRAQGFTDFKDSLSETYRKREYCVQYRETDFNFISRLMEEEGIYYFFEHENGKHTLVLADSKSAHAAYPGYENIPYRVGEQPGKELETIHEWSLEQQIQPGIVSLNDFDFAKPKTDLTVKATVSRSQTVLNYEVYDYPGDYLEHGDGEAYARRRIEELQVEYEFVRGSSRAQGISPGFLFTLDNHPREDQNREYLVISTSYEITADPLGTTAELEENKYCLCHFSAIRSDSPFRTARRAVKPSVKGPQTAIVVGPAGEEIYVDKYGRVKVQFHWDRRGLSDENSSCWMRVSQLYTGKNWGAMHSPRIGQEVIVDFLEGDPDRPIITGRVYNGESMPPYALPDHMTISTVKSNSTKGGKGFNEIRFEDKKGEEQIYLHAQKNHDLRIKHNEYEWVGNDRHLVVGHDQVEHVKHDRHETVDNDHVEKIGRDRNVLVVGKEAKEVDASCSLTVIGDVIEVFKQNHSETVTNDYYLKADNIVIEALTNITIKVGDSFIAIEKDGIKIGTKGQIQLESTGTTAIKATGALSAESCDAFSIKGMSVSLKANTSMEMKGLSTSVAADADLEVKSSGKVTIKGAMVMIN